MNMAPLARGEAPHRLLVILPERTIGSNIAALPAVRALRRHLGLHTRLWFIAPAAGKSSAPSDEILRNEDGFAGLLLLEPHPGPIALFGLWRTLSRLGIDCAAYLDLAGAMSGRVVKYRAFMRSLGIRHLFGFRVMERQRQKRDVENPRVAELRVRQIARDGIAVPPDFDCVVPLIHVPDRCRESVSDWLRRYRSHPDRPLIAVCPGARSPANLWGEDRFRALGQRILGLERHEIVLCGGPADHAMAERLVAAWGQGINAAGAFTVLESAALFETCAFMVGLDTGSTHLAAAVGARCVVLQGGRAFPGNWNPIGNHPTILRFPVPCTGCGLVQCGLSQHPCMRGLAVETVWQAIVDLQRKVDEQHRARS